METEPKFRSFGDALDSRISPRIAPGRHKSAPRTHFESEVDPYLKFIVWDNATLENDMRLFWMKVHQFNKVMPSGELKRLLEWAKRLDCLSPRQFVAAINSAILKKHGKGVK